MNSRHLSGAFLVCVLGCTISVSAAAAPANDNFANRIVLGGSTTIVTSGTNVDATKETGEPFHWSSTGGKSVWWSWTAPFSGSFVINTFGSNFDTVLAAYVGSAVNALNLVANNDDFSGTQSQITIAATSGVTYQIAVDGFSASSGLISLTIQYPSPPPANDNFANASALASGAATVVGSNLGATKQSGEPSHAGYGGGKSVWYSWTAPSSGDVIINCTSGGFYPLVGVYTGAAVNVLTEAGRSSFGNPGTFRATSGVTYFIAVDGYSGAAGSFSLEVSHPIPPPPNDNFANASMLASGATTLSGSNLGATRESGEPNHGGYSGGTRSVWYAWTAPASGTVNVRALGNSFSVLCSVYTGTTVSALTNLGEGAFGDEFSFAASSGLTYFIAVDGFNGEAGSFSLTIGNPIAPPPNDNFANAQVLSATPLFIQGTTVGATREPGEPNHYGSGRGSVWYSWTAPATGNYTLGLAHNGNMTNAVMAVYTGSSIATLSQVESNGYNSPVVVQLNAVQGTTYRIVVDSFPGQGSFVLGVSTPPSNDLFANAITLGTVSTAMSSSWVDANVSFETGEPDAPLHPWEPGPRSIWWNWTSPVTDFVQIDTLGSSFDSILDIFTGTSLETLTPVAMNSDANALGASSVTFPATSGVTYWIRVRDDESRLFGAVDLRVATLGPAITADDHVKRGRAYLQLQSDAGISNADAEFSTALTIDPNHPEASLLKALTGFAMLEQGAAFQTALTGLGILDSSIYSGAYAFPKDGMGAPIPTPGTHTSAAVDYLSATVLPGLVTLRGHLDKVSSPSFFTTLSDSETGVSFVKIDAADVGVFRAGTFALEAVIRLLRTFNAGASVADAIEDYNNGQFNAESAISAFTNLLGTTGTNDRTTFKTAIQSAVSAYVGASDFARNVRSDDPLDHLFPLESKDFATEQEMLSIGQSVSQSFDGPASVGGEMVDLSKFVTSGKSLREQLPGLHENLAVAGTTPDPTFDGVIPNSSQTKVNGFLRKNGLLYEVNSFGNWAAVFLKGLDPADQTKSANPDKDLLNNFGEYVFNLSPTVPNGSQAFQVNQLETDVVDGKKYLHISFVRRIVRNDISYVVAVSDNLSGWDRTQTQVQQVGLPQPTGDGETEVVTYRLLASPEVTARKFVRIEVTDLAP